MSDRSETIWAVGGSTILIAALAAIVLGVSQCISYERWKERTCLQIGGAIISNASPGSGGSGNRDACMKVDVQLTPLPMPTK